MGLTLIELLVVVGIVGVLIGLLIPGLMLVRKQQKRLETVRALHELGQAISTALQERPLLDGRTDRVATDFMAEPMRFLARAAGKRSVPLYALPPRRAARRSADGAWVRCAPGEATLVLDAWDAPLVFTVENGPYGADAGRYEFSDNIEIRSGGPSPIPGDDIVWRFSVSGDVEPRDGARDPDVVPREWAEVRKP